VCAVSEKAAVAAEPSRIWELDFYSRPVQGADGKKLWELLITDGANSFRHVEAVPSNCVNSRELRSRVQRLIDEAEVRPSTIRFFRSQMKNMISIALNELPDVACKPSRVTCARSSPSPSPSPTPTPSPTHACPALSLVLVLSFHRPLPM
jgi:hypothetical protein